MPRPNKARTLGSERTLAQRIAYEREARDLTYERLADKMTQAGCSIQPSAIYKIEKGDPPRRVTVDELVALANVFEVGLEDMLIPISALMTRKAHALVKRWAQADEALEEAREAAQLAWVSVLAHLVETTESRATVTVALADACRLRGLSNPDAHARALLRKAGNDLENIGYREVDGRFVDTKRGTN